VGAGKVLGDAGVYLDVAERSGYGDRAMRKALAPICFLAGLAVAALPALGADQSVTANADLTFGPATVTVTQGEKVTWSNAGGPHNVHFDDGSYVQPADPEETWTVPVERVFDVPPGTYRYYCEAHGGADGNGMVGAVVVKAPSTGTTTGPSGPTSPGGSTTAPDKAAPVLALSGKRRQNVVRQRAVVVAIRADEPVTVAVSGGIALPGKSTVIRLRRVTRTLAAGTVRKIKLRIAKRPLRAVRRALLRRVRLSARLTVTAKDRAGNVRTARRKVGLRGP
jgi:plastocyanin